jgi:hypothetical protein
MVTRVVKATLTPAGGGSPKGQLRETANALTSLNNTNLAGYWTFVGNTGNDASGNSRTATLVAAPTFTAGQVGNAMVTNGTTQCATVPNFSVPGSYTVSLWFYQITQQNAGLFTKNGSSVNGDFSLWIGGGGSYITADLTTSTGYQYIQPTAITPNVWNYAACVYDSVGNTLTLYFNGVAYQTPITGSFSNDASGTFNISSMPGATFFPGRINDVRVYTRALSSAEIGAIYNAGTAGSALSVPSFNGNGGLSCSATILAQTGATFKGNGIVSPPTNITVTDIGATTAAASQTVALTGVTVPAGSFIYVAVTDYNNPTLSSYGTLSDGVNASYTPIYQHGSGSDRTFSEFIVWNSLALNNATITYTSPLTNSYLAISALYASNILTSANPLDVQASQAFGSWTPSTSFTPAISELAVATIHFVLSGLQTPGFTQDTVDGWNFPPDWNSSWTLAGGNQITDQGGTALTYAPVFTSQFGVQPNGFIVLNSFKARNPPDIVYQVGVSTALPGAGNLSVDPGPQSLNAKAQFLQTTVPLANFTRQEVISTALGPYYLNEVNTIQALAGHSYLDSADSITLGNSSLLADATIPPPMPHAEFDGAGGLAASAQILYAANATFAGASGLTSAAPILNTANATFAGVGSTTDVAWQRWATNPATLAGAGGLVANLIWRAQTSALFAGSSEFTSLDAISYDPDNTYSGLTLSPDNLTVTAPGAVFGMAIGTVPVLEDGEVGFYYHEVTFSLGGASTQSFGIAPITTPLQPGQQPGFAYEPANGLLFSNGTLVASGFTTATSGTIGIAINVSGGSSSTIWVTLDGVTWNNSGGANPTTNTGGFGTGTAFVQVAPFALFNRSGDTATLNVGNSAFAFAPPASFLPLRRRGGPRPRVRRIASSLHGGSGLLAAAARQNFATSALHAGSGLLATALWQTFDSSTLHAGSGLLVSALVQVFDTVSLHGGSGLLVADTSGPVQFGSTALAGAGSLTTSATLLDVARTTLVGAGGLSADSFPQYFASAIFAGSGGLATAASELIGALTTLAGVGSLTANSIVENFASATFAGAGSLTTVVVELEQAQSLLVGTGGLSADTSIPEEFASATFAGAGSLTAAALELAVARSTLSGAGGLAGDSIVENFASALFSGVGTLTAVASELIIAQTELDGVGSLTADGFPTQFLSSTFAGDGELTAAVYELIAAQTELDGSGGLTAAASELITAISSFAGVGTLLVDSEIENFASAEFDGAGSLVAVAYLLLTASTELDGVGGLTVVGIPEEFASAELDGVGGLSVATLLLRFTSATFAGSGDLVASALQYAATSATFAGVGGLITDAIPEAFDNAELDGAGGLTVVASLLLPTSTELDGVGSLSTAASELIVALATFQGVGGLFAAGRSTSPNMTEFDGEGGLTAVANKLLITNTEFDGSGALTAAIAQLYSATTALAGAGGLTTDTIPALHIESTLAGSGSIVAALTLLFAARTQFSGIGQLAAAASVLLTTGAELDGVGGLTVSLAPTTLQAGPGVFTLTGAPAMLSVALPIFVPARGGGGGGGGEVRKLKRSPLQAGIGVFTINGYPASMVVGNVVVPFIPSPEPVQEEVDQGLSDLEAATMMLLLAD